VIRDPGFYVLAIGDEPQGDLRKYVEWGEREGVPALRLGDRWYQHIWRQLQTKRPYGHVFIHDKVDLTRTGSWRTTAIGPCAPPRTSIS
jgi:hypothetical protein